MKNWDFSKVQGATSRFGVVVYITALLLALPSAYAFVVDEYPVSDQFIYAGLFLLGWIIVVEITRRVLLYILSGKDFIKNPLPRSVKLLGALAIVFFPVSLGCYLFYELPQERAIERQAYERYLQAKGSLPGAKKMAADCVLTVDNQPVTTYESVQCRSTRLDYDACREYLSHTQCIAIHDYESSCNQPSVAHALQDIRAKRECNAASEQLQSSITTYELNHPEVMNSSNP